MDIKAGSADQSVSFAAFTTETGAAVTVTSATAGLSLWYRRGTTGAKTTISPSDLATLITAHADGGILVVGGQEHRLDLPDAAVAAGADSVTWGGEATGITIDGGVANLIGQATTSPVKADIPAALTDYQQRGVAVTLNQADIRAAVGLNTANLDAQLVAINGYVDCLPATWVIPAAAGAKMDLVDVPNATALTAIGTKIEAMAFDEGDATALLAAIAAKVEAFLLNDGDASATLAAIGAACNAAVSAAHGAGSYLTATGFATPTNVSETQTAILNAVGDVPTVNEFNARSLPSADYFIVSDYTAPPNAATIASQVRTELATELGRIDAAVTSRQATVTNLADVVTMASKFGTMVVLNGAVWEFTEGALVNSPPVNFSPENASTVAEAVRLELAVELEDITELRQVIEEVA